MKQHVKAIFLLSLMVGGMLFSFADRGIRKKSKSHVSLNIGSNNSIGFKKSLSLAFSNNNGLHYKGSLLLSEKKENQSLVSSSLMTFQKGNTIYILPVKQKIFVPEIKQGYTGMKLIIKPH
ncbi:MAG TPA: hypothetical protein PKK69_06545 [Ferruginibacter sp.]|nr:hypothetical protein [Ferruginibacter sp.]